MSSGGLAVIEALKSVTSKIQAEHVEKECEYVFMSPAASTGRDADTQCRWSALQCVQELFERVPAGRKTVDVLRMVSTFLELEPSTRAIDKEVRYSNRRTKM